MSPRPIRIQRRAGLNSAVALSLSVMLVLAAAGVRGQALKTSPAAGGDPEINKQFLKPDVKALVEKLEAKNREVYVVREAIVKALELKGGMDVADIGAGTGLFTRLLANGVGPEGTVYAVDIARPLLRHIEIESKKLKQSQVKTVLATQDSIGLPANSVDLAFVCDAYHHFENPGRSLASIAEALRPNGLLVVIEFDRSKPSASDFVKKHVRANPTTFVAEIKAAGFEPLATPNAPALQENVFLRFRKRTGPPRSSGPVGG